MLSKKIVFLFVLINIIFSNFSYSQNYNAIDSIILKYPDFGTTEKLAERIQKDFTTDYDKARAIYSWIALNINYDLKTYLDPPEPKVFNLKDPNFAKKVQLQNANSSQKAFRSRKAVCEGFAQLYLHLSSLAGLKCQVVSGDSKILLNDIGRRRLETNHAWNQVLIDGKWRLVDVTWGQGYYDEKFKVMRTVFTPIYFDQNQKYFYAKHFPESSMYAGNTGNKEAFLNGPLIYNEAISEDYEILVPYSGVIRADDADKITFKIKNIKKFEDVYYLNKKDEPIKVENIKEDNGVTEFQITYNRKLGRFITLYLYGKGIASFKVIPKVN